MLTTDDINLGGGALMDLGHYPLNALRKYSGMEPAVVSAVSTPPPPGVGDARIDQSLEAELVFPDGSTAGLECSMWAESFSMELRVTYEDGRTGRVRSYLSPGSKGVIWDKDGAVIVYDADTLEEEKRIPMNKPSGKYNVWNKINYEEGTSH